MTEDIVYKKVLIYKRTHTGDPNEITTDAPDKRGIFGINTCMGRVRSWEFDAVIGVGGKSAGEGIAYRINYVGLGVKKHSINPQDGHPYVIFDHFRLFDEEGKFVEKFAPNLYKYMYEDADVRRVKSDSSRIRDNVLIQSEIQKILNLAKNAPPSSGCECLGVMENTPCTPAKENNPTNKDTKGGCR
jgi:hypothetical protein